jgi:hypothetical protein
LVFVGGLSSVVPMPSRGFALWSAARRNYAVTLHAALAPAGIYAGTIAIGGLIERGDIHKAMLASPVAALHRAGARGGRRQCLRHLTYSAAQSQTPFDCGKTLRVMLAVPIAAGKSSRR